MTYLVSDGKVFIADKFCSKQFPTIHGRKTQDADGNRKDNKPASKIYYNDTSKIELISAGKYEGVDLKLVAMAGATGHLHRALSYLERGNDILDAMNLEACLPVDDRIFFRKDCSFMFVNVKNEVLFSAADPDNSSVAVYNRSKGGFLHKGCGTTPVNAFCRFIKRQITPLEAFVLASQLHNNVSEEFDYYDLESDTLVHDQKLTTRQRTKILDQLQSELVIDRDIQTVKYVNEIYRVIKEE